MKSKEQKDLVSVIMPSYNTAKYIKKAIESVCNQTYTNWELIIIDDNSTDNTEDVIRCLLADERIHFYKNKKNLGAAVSRNRALRKAKGRWISFLDSDDIWLKDKLEKQIRFMEEHDYHFSYTPYVEIDEMGCPKGLLVTGPKKITYSGMVRYCWPGCLTVMYDREFVGLIQIADIKKNNDYAMWLKVSRNAKCFLYSGITAKYRRGRSGSISSGGYRHMIRWHYKLFYEAEKNCRVKAWIYTIQNLFFAMIKKIIYVKHYTV